MLRKETLKRCVLAEELGHCRMKAGEIFEQSSVAQVKEELKSCRWAHEKLVHFQRLLQVVRTGLECVYDIAELFEVPGQFMIDAILHYQNKYGGNFYKTCRLSV